MRRAQGTLRIGRAAPGRGSRYVTGMRLEDPARNPVPLAEPVPRHAPLGFPAFVAIMAALMALNALAVDIMLPALPAIAASLGAAGTTEVQTVIIVYMLGFGVGQVGAGLLADRYGRRPVLLAGLALYTLASAAIVLAPSLGAVLALRFLQGFASSAPRVIGVAAVRDCYEGRRMARVMSLTMMVFTAAPILAPALGQLMLVAGSWRLIFVFLALYAALLLLVCARSLPETLRPEHRRPIRRAAVAGALASMFGARQTVGYMLATGCFFGALFGYITSAQQVMVETYGLGHWFPAVFALTALSLSASSFLNSRLVERLGMRLLSHAAVAAFVLLSLLMAALGRAGLLPAPVFVPLMMLTLPLVGLIFSNFTALAMAPQGHVAGIASSVIGSVTTLIGAGLGYLIGQSFDGTAMPLVTGFALSGIATLLVVLVTERGRVFGRGG